MQKLFFAEPPKKICVLRLSALGDVCHTLPTVRSIQAQWPETEITWIIGKLEYQLLSDIDNIKFVIFDKSAGLSAYLQLKKALKDQYFDVLLHMQTSLRSNIASLFISAKVKLGFDKQRARELHSLVTNHKIAPAQRQHQVDDIFNFAQALGIKNKLIQWQIPIRDEARDKIRTLVTSNKAILAINPCSSPSKRVFRNWIFENYAEIADYAAENLGYQIVICGGPTELEIKAGGIIESKMLNPVTNLVGKTSIKELLALLDQSSLLITSDSGPAHIATAVNTPVIALHAATNPFQTGPYLCLDKTVNKYPEAINAEYHKTPEELSWGIRAHGEEVMSRISANDVIQQLEKVNQQLLNKNK